MKKLIIAAAVLAGMFTGSALAHPAGHPNFKSLTCTKVTNIDGEIRHNTPKKFSAVIDPESEQATVSIGGETYKLGNWTAYTDETTNWAHAENSDMEGFTYELTVSKDSAIGDTVSFVKYRTGTTNQVIDANSENCKFTD